MIFACGAKDRPFKGVLADIDEPIPIYEVHSLSHERRRQSLASNQDGQTMVEYAALVTLVALVATAAYLTFGQAIVAMFGPIINAVTL